MGKIEVKSWDTFAEDKILDFLYQHKETSLFLLDNYQRSGAKIGQELFSGNFKILMDADQICAVFCLTKSANLLIQSDNEQDCSDAIYTSCLEEEIAITGFVGNWKDGDLFWTYIKKIKTLILFTGHENQPAQKLYKKLGFKHIGYFGLLFWDN